MKVKLIKTGKNLYRLLYVNENTTAEHNELFDGKLSLKNCQVIERGYDLEKIASTFMNSGNTIGGGDSGWIKAAFIEGFQKRLEILGDDIFEWLAKKDYLSDDKNILKEEYNQQTEWDVIVEMECVIGCQNLILNGENSVCCGDKKPKIEDGCLILKRI